MSDSNARPSISGSTAAEDVEEQSAVRVIGEGEAAERALDRSSREEAAIQKRHATERTRRSRAPGERRVERAKKKRTEHAIAKASAVRRASIEVADEEAAIAVQPALCLEEREENEPRCVQ
jgi:hypothetical protein